MSSDHVAGTTLDKTHLSQLYLVLFALHVVLPRLLNPTAFKGWSVECFSDLSAAEILPLKAGEQSLIVLNY